MQRPRPASLTLFLVAATVCLLALGGGLIQASALTTGATMAPPAPASATASALSTGSYSRGPTSTTSLCWLGCAAQHNACLENGGSAAECQAQYNQCINNCF